MNKVVTTEPVSDAAALMAVITKAATDPAVDVEKMERLFALYQQMDAQRKERAFNEAMAECQAEMPQVFKDRANEHKNYRYSTLEEVNKTIVPIYTKHGFSLSFGTTEGAPANHYRMTCRASHKEGHSRDYQADLPTDMVGDKGNPNKTAIQGFGSSMSYGRRYLTLLIFNISTTDDNDGASTSSDTLSEEQQATITALLEKHGLPIAPLLQWAKVGALGDITADRYDRVLDAVTKSAKNKGGK